MILELENDFFEDARALSDMTALMKSAADAAESAEGTSLPLCAHVILTNNERIRRENALHRGIDRATDVLSFPTVQYKRDQTAKDSERKLRSEFDADENACFMGDIIISVPMARAQAAEYGHSDAREAAYLLTHGLLHLMGYDHVEQEDQRRMRAMEEKALNSIGLTRVSDDELIQLAKEAMKNSYSPYSKYAVGACLLAKSGRVYQGCNIENAAYGACNCAERTALFKAVSEGEREFVAIAVAAQKAMPWPCGICRQALNEFAPRLRVIVSCGDERDEMPLDKLLPNGFGPDAGMLEILGKD